jgi:hypothetical protein
MATQTLRETDMSQKPAYQLKTGERSESRGGEPNDEIPVDTGSQVSFSLSHDSWPFGGSEVDFEHLLQTTPRGPIQAERRLDLAIGSPSVFSKL